MKCHMSSSKGKVRNLLRCISVAEIYFQACLLANQNVHCLLKPGQLPSTALPKRISLIFICTELYWRAPIPVFNTLQYTVYICWREMGCTLLFCFAAVLHNWFQNLLSILVMNYWQRDDKLGVFWEHKWWVKLYEICFGRINDECR